MGKLKYYIPTSVGNIIPLGNKTKIVIGLLLILLALALTS